MTNEVTLEWARDKAKEIDAISMWYGKERTIQELQEVCAEAYCKVLVAIFKHKIPLYEQHAILQALVGIENAWQSTTLDE